MEAALALCSLVAVTAMSVSAVGAASAQLRCIDAAREAARLVARGEPDRAREVADSIAPRNAAIDVRVVGDEATVVVSSSVLFGLPNLTVTGRAVSVLEPSALATVPVGGPAERTQGRPP